MNVTTINGIQLAYRDEGQGTPLVLIHAFPLSHAMWEPQIADLSSNLRLIVPDLRGFGASELGEIPTSMEQYADDIGALLDSLGIARVALAGLSMGGYVAFAFLRKYRARVTALILADTRSGPDSDEGKMLREQNARMVENQGLKPLAEQMIPKLLAPNASTSLQNHVRQLIENNNDRGIAAALRAMATRPDSMPLLATIDVPTVVVVGTKDPLTPPSEAYTMSAKIPNSRLIEIADAAHLTNMEDPTAFNEGLRFVLPA
ncbi:MAG: alpha/beta fold hydrolase [Chloroflexi bacterium AL-W]|nr:alpha/beta fold hydrolase [Chloroflexi bacterium AL-N1]NOK66403.1 alpha/beta fold hydrolase [Chloroflexi bacterium AL-N10]NOK71791.1 alpha/beta fold hydrolase [Chloroflexi bacterium AL-N5]NOK81048.1 alpha/beta fold hydrolase [Chloroflexi bacterium AL-W]NOK89321.1 alpha/beta fold hydrolase [Chloroflexi bacterium AL-N15]